MEVVISDDCSPEPYDDIVQKYENKLTIVRTKTAYNCCPGNTRQAGYDASSGDWVIFGDQDDEYVPGAFHKVFKQIEKSERNGFRFPVVTTDFDEGSYVKGQFHIITRHSRSYGWTHGKFYRREWWEKSEAFLGGAASDFDIDPGIDSWPLNRDLLHSYFTTGQFSEEALDDQSILGFHALEFVLFRDGKNRTVAEFQSNDTYKGFTDVKGAEELKYAEAVAKELVISCYNLEVAWSETPNAARLKAVQDADRDYLTKKGKSFGWNMKNSGSVESTFDGLNDALSQVLNDDEGSAVAIADEVGSGKIGHPFQSGYIFYVESPYSYNSLTDFQNNIRSIENVWYGNTNGAKGSASVSLSQWFAKNDSKTGQAVEAAISSAISKIGAIPGPFVKYVSTIWNKSFEDDEVVEIPE